MKPSSTLRMPLIFSLITMLAFVMLLPAAGCKSADDKANNSNAANKPTSLLDSLQGSWHVLSNAPRSIEPKNKDEMMAMLALTESCISAKGGIHPDTVYMVIRFGADGKGEQSLRAPEGSMQNPIIYGIDGRQLRFSAAEVDGEAPWQEFTIVSVSSDKLVLKRPAEVDKQLEKMLLGIGASPEFIKSLTEVWVFERVQPKP